MLASIWLQVVGNERAMLHDLIVSLAAQHGTVPFQPHLTVCGAADLNPACWDAAAEYVRSGELLPLTAEKLRISHSATEWSRAVTIDVRNSAAIDAFRQALSRITGGAIAAPPHISLLYTADDRGQPPSWAASEPRLRAIADECAAAVDVTQFVLADPVVVAPDEDWVNIKSWKVVRRL